MTCWRVSCRPIGSEKAGVFVVSMVSSPGAGKTALLEKILGGLRQRRAPGWPRWWAILPPITTPRASQRSEAPRASRLRPARFATSKRPWWAKALEDWDLEELDFLFIENVGNLVCPSSYDLGENLRMVLMSVTEGEDKPRSEYRRRNFQYGPDIALITKADLAAAVEFDEDAAARNIEAIRPGMEIRQVSAKTGANLEPLMDWLVGLKILV